MSEPAISFPQLQDRTLGNRELMAELLGLFRSESLAALDHLRQAAGRQDMATARRVTHRFKSSAATIGATALAALLAVAESECVAGRPISLLLPAIEAETGRCNREIEAFLNSQMA